MTWAEDGCNDNELFSRNLLVTLTRNGPVSRETGQRMMITEPPCGRAKASENAAMSDD